MTWGKVSDDLHSHPKWTAASPNAKALWTTALSYSSGYLTDGCVDRALHLPTIAVETFGLTATAMKRATTAADELVARGLWSATDTGWRFHDWKDNNPTAAQVRRRKKHDKRRDWLHKTTEGKELKRIVRARDGDLCSWHGGPVRWGANRAPDGATYDHIDADGPDTEWNLVVSCNNCNGTKRDVDHDEIGFHLRAGHALFDRYQGNRIRTDPPSASTRPSRDSVATQSSRTSEAGTGRVGSGRGEAKRSATQRSAVDADPPPHDDHHFTGDAA